MVRKNGAVHGYVDTCPHAGWPLAAYPDRYLTREADRILCFGHGALFRIEDGVCLAGPCQGQQLQPWPVAAGADGVVRTV